MKNNFKNIYFYSHVMMWEVFLYLSLDGAYKKKEETTEKKIKLWGEN